MCRPNLISCCLLLAACAPPDHFCDYSSPEGAARTFLEAGRNGDTDGMRASLVAAERDLDFECDYGDIGDYRLKRGQDIDRDHVVVLLHVGAIRSSLVCERESDGWKVSIRGSLAWMQQVSNDRQPAAPR